MSEWTLAVIAEKLQARLDGDETCVINGVAPLVRAQGNQVAFFEDQKQKELLKNSSAGAILIKERDAVGLTAKNLLIVDKPKIAFAQLLHLLYPVPKKTVGIHPSAHVGHGCIIHPTAVIGPSVVIGDRVTVGADSILEAGVVLGDDVKIGEGCHLHPRVTLYKDVHISNKVIIHAGAVLGSDGFGFVADDMGRLMKIPQVGRVIVEDDVEIGANTTIDRGALDDTVIERGAKIDNLVMIAHNVRIGAHSAIAGCVGIAGSSRIGKHCLLGGGVGIADHVEIADHVMLTAASGVAHSIEQPGVYGAAFSARPFREWQRLNVRFLELGELAKRLRHVEKALNIQNGGKEE